MLFDSLIFEGTFGAIGSFQLPARQRSVFHNTVINGAASFSARRSLGDAKPISLKRQRAFISAGCSRTAPPSPKSRRGDLRRRIQNRLDKSNPSLPTTGVLTLSMDSLTRSGHERCRL